MSDVRPLASSWPAARQAALPIDAPSPAHAAANAVANAAARLHDPGAPLREQRPRVSCVVPCFNEAANLNELLPRLSAVLSSCSDEWEIILVDDGSSDDTVLLLRQWARRPGVVALQLSRNFGKEAALTAGIARAVGDVVVMLDADQQHDPRLIPQFIFHWCHGADMVYAVRATRDDEAWHKRVGTRLFYGLLNRSGRFEVPAGAGDFRLMDRSVVDALMALPERNRFMKGLYAWVGYQTVAVPYQPEVRAHGRTHFNPLRLAHLALDGLTSFTTWPLRAASALGVLLALAAFMYGAYLTLVYFLYGHTVSGWTTIVVGLMFFSGLQLLFLGVVGEYVGRIFEEVKGRPLYVVKNAWGTGLNASRK
ncbi:glycosyltransferase family 2 protein [Mitsuaria sp. 7]|uniref:glycosyltransferase family 2 protein n=1 Tax=Mitsuaria sp. 7 TaxID=1658665 RepID=UPI0009EF0EAE|nr:glycosyltransferase family 2 protein [Mitsuaria sp. 7]